MKKTSTGIGILCLILSFQTMAQYAPDQSYDGPISYGITSSNFVAFNVRYVLTGPNTYRNEIRTDGPLTTQLEDGAFRFDVLNSGGLSAVRIEMGNATSFKLSSLSFYGKADGNISFIPNGNVANAVTFNSSGSFITQLNYGFSSHSSFSNITSFTITGANLSIEIDDVIFDPPQAILPVHLLSFDVSRVSKKNRINWSTAWESNCSRFEVERSADGVNYNKLLTVSPGGNPSSGSVYSVMDETPLSGKNFYRLVQYDTDGRATHHGVRMISTEDGRHDVSLSSYPNPVDNVLTITNYRSSSSYSIYNQAGTKVMTGPLMAGQSQLNVSSLSTGVYILMLDNSRSQLRFVKR